MDNNEESRNPMVSRLVMDYLSLQPGPVIGVLLVCVRFSSSPEAIFHALHTVKALTTAPINYVVNSTRHAQLIVRCTNPVDALNLDYTRGTFKFNDTLIKCINLETISMLPYDEDDVYSCTVEHFLACHEGNSIMHYPRGFGTAIEDMDLHYYPTLSATTMDILGVQEGPSDSLLRVEIKYFGRLRDFLYAIRVANLPNHKFAVHQDGTMYMKYRTTFEAHYTSIHHFYVGGHMMIKFYRVAYVNKRIAALDASFMPIYFRASIDDAWERVV